MPNQVPQCTHVKTNGEVCGSPAVSGTTFCYHHSAAKTALGKVKPQAGPGGFAPIPFVFPEDRASMQINFFLLLQAFNGGRVDLRTYRAMLSTLKAMAANLGKTGSLVEEPSREAASKGAASKKAASEGAVSNADGLESLLNLKASATVAPENCFSKNPQVQGTDNDLFRISTLDLAGHGFRQAAQPLARS